MWIAFFHFYFFPLCGGVTIQTHNKAASCWTKQWVLFFFFLGWISLPLCLQGLCYKFLSQKISAKTKSPCKHRPQIPRWTRANRSQAYFASSVDPVQCNTLSLLLAQDVRQEKARERERGEGWPADSLPHCSSGGGETGWVHCRHSCTVSFTWAAWLCAFFSNISGGTFYDPEKTDYSDFKAWLQCYYVDGMKSVRDHNGRTIWFNVSFLVFFVLFVFLREVFVFSPFWISCFKFLQKVKQPNMNKINPICQN